MAQIIKREDADILGLTDFQKEELGLLASSCEDVDKCSKSCYNCQLNEEFQNWTEFVLGG